MHKSIFGPSWDEHIHAETLRHFWWKKYVSARVYSTFDLCCKNRDKTISHLPWQYTKSIIDSLYFYAIYLLFQPVRGYRPGAQIATSGTVYRSSWIISWMALYSVKTQSWKICVFRSIYQQNMKVLKFTVFTPFQNLSDCEDNVCFCGTRLDAVFKLPYYLGTSKITNFTKIIRFSNFSGSDVSNFRHFVIFGVPR